MPRKILVSRATFADAALLAALHTTSFNRSHERSLENPWGEEDMARFIAGPGTLCLIGLTGNMEPAPSGLLIARQVANEAAILTIGVVAQCRRLGVGQTLLQHAMTALHTGGAKRLFLEVDETNIAAVALYRALGAAPVGHRRRYYENGTDAAIFSLALSVPHSDDARSAYEPREDQR